MNNDWIEWTWTEEKPYPETWETKVYIKQADGFCDDDCGYPDTVGYWYDEDYESSNWFQGHEDKCYITHYKLA